jgi:hypothetical protein
LIDVDPSRLDVPGPAADAPSEPVKAEIDGAGPGVDAAADPVEAVPAEGGRPAKSRATPHQLKTSPGAIDRPARPRLTQREPGEGPDAADRPPKQWKPGEGADHPPRHGEQPEENQTVDLPAQLRMQQDVEVPFSPRELAEARAALGSQPYAGPPWSTSASRRPTSGPRPATSR